MIFTIFKHFGVTGSILLVLIVLLALAPKAENPRQLPPFRCGMYIGTWIHEVRIGQHTESHYSPVTKAWYKVTIEDTQWRTKRIMKPGEFRQICKNEKP